MPVMLSVVVAVAVAAIVEEKVGGVLVFVAGIGGGGAL